MESLPDGWVENEVGQRVYNPLEIAKKMVEGQGRANKDRIQRREAVVDDLSGLSLRQDASESRLDNLEAKFKALYAMVETLQERVGE